MENMTTFNYDFGIEGDKRGNSGLGNQNYT